MTKKIFDMGGGIGKIPCIQSDCPICNCFNKTKSARQVKSREDLTKRFPEYKDIIDEPESSPTET